MGSWKNKCWTFIIGFVAGAAPFLCMAYVPPLIDPDAVSRPPQVLGLVLVGLIVALVTVVTDAKDFDKVVPRDVLMRALAVPSILLATVTALQSRQVLDSQIQASSAAVDSTSVDVNITPVTTPLEEIAPQPASDPRTGWLWVPEALAQPGTTPRPGTAAPQPLAGRQYLVVLGTFTNQKDASNAVRRWSPPQSFGTERYYQKSVRMFRGGSQTFYVTYTTPLPRGEAMKLYKLLRINDPKITPQVIEHRVAAASGGH